jgi:uncharacterized membrane protein
MRHITSTFLQGLSVVLPLALTIWVVIWLAISTEELLKPLFLFLLPQAYYLPGLGLLMGLVIIYAAGVLVNVFIIQSLWQALQRLVERIPLVKTLFTALKDFFDFFSSKPADSGSTVVKVDLGRGAMLIGFITDQKPIVNGLDDTSEPRVAVYLPLSYMIGGYTVWLPRSQLEPLDISPQDAMRLVLTAGIQKRS